MAGNPEKQTCELFYRTIRDMTPEQAAAKCNTGTVTRSLRDLRKPVEITAPQG